MLFRFCFMLVALFCTLPAVRSAAAPQNISGPKALIIGTPFTPLRINNNLVLFSDYAKVYTLNIKTKRIEQLRVISKGSDKEVPLHPTGLTRLAGDRIAIANYSKRNVLLGNYESATGFITVDVVLADRDMIGAEGLATDGRLLFVADHDGNKVFAFDVTDAPHKVWAINLPIPHGITVSPQGRLFVTSMAERTITELNPRTGTVLGVIGKMGMAKNKAEFLWPACILATGGDNIIVSDGHTGYVKRIDFKTSRVLAVTEGNGPGLKHFSNPGCMTPFGENLFLMTSAYQIRFVVMDVNHLRVQSDWVVDLDSRPFLKSMNGPNFIEGWNLNRVGWGYQSSKALTVLGQRYYLGYARLIPEDHKKPTLTFYHQSPFFKTGSYTYLLDLYDTGRAGCLFSNASGPIYCFPYDGFTLFPFVMRADRWVVGDKIISSLDKSFDKPLSAERVHTALDEVKGLGAPELLNTIRSLNNLPLETTVHPSFADLLTDDPNLVRIKSALRAGEDIEPLLCGAIREDRSVEFSDVMILSQVIGRSVLTALAECPVFATRKDRWWSRWNNLFRLRD